jgi:arylsulfatase A-like enzyme
MASAAPLLAQKKSSGIRPAGIVVILADDLSAWMLGCYGNQEIRTPAVDLLARSGTRFLHHCVCTPASAPSRATLFTGRVPRQHGILDVTGGNVALRNETLIQDVLAAAGYNCEEVTTAGGRAAQFLEAQKPGQNFFLVANGLSPLAPYDGLPQKYYDMYAKAGFVTTGWLPAAANASEGKEYLKDTVGSLRKCAAAVSALDDQVAALVSVLDKRGLRDGTLLIFTSINGMLGGRHGLWGTGLGSDPINMYADVVETPMIWNWPGRIPTEGARPELVSSYDFFPSILEVAGLTPPAGGNLCGRSYLSPVMNTPLPRKQPWHNLVYGALRNTEMMRDARFKLVLRDNGASPGELYDWRADPLEHVNQYDNAAFITTRAAMTKQLRAWREKYV